MAPDSSARTSSRPWLRARTECASLTTSLPEGTEGDLPDLESKLISDVFQEPACYDALLLAVPHRTFIARSTHEYLELLRDDNCAGVMVDIKGALRAEEFTAAGVYYGGCRA